ncbi:MAG: N-acetylglucosamine-6-phosphate deacetylase [Acidimicrobiia bacterium]
MAVTVVESARTLLGDAGLVPARVTIADGLIVAIDRLGPAESPPDDATTLGPSFVDLQVNGVDEHDVWEIALAGDVDAWDDLSERLVDAGVGAWCPTLISSALTNYPAAMGFLASRTDDPRVLGVHLEGPFLGSALGAHRVEAVREPEKVGDFVLGLGSSPVLMTIGCEHPGSARAIEELTDRGIVVSLGHTQPDRAGYEAAVVAGARMVTHLFNAMGGLGHRDPGLSAWVLRDDRVVAGLIADGVHVHPDMIELAFHCKPDGIALVTDTVAWRSGRVGSVVVATAAFDGAPRLPDGTLAGSNATMSRCLRTCVAAGVPLERAWRAATRTPARVMGRLDRGVLAVGARADLVRLDDRLEPVAVWSMGTRVR